MKSESVEKLAAALVQFQSEVPAVKMNAVNKFLGNRYADLGETIRVAQPVLAKNGLSVSQQATSTPGLVGVTTTLMHTSGQWIEDTIVVPLGDEKGKSMAQVAGSIITYLRRYSYGSIIGLYTDEDTDGEHTTSKPASKPAQATPAQVKPPAQATPAQATPAQATPAQATPGNGNGKMSLEMAETEKNANGILYKDIDTPTLVSMFNEMAKLKKDNRFTEEHQRKSDAIQVLLKSRGDNAA